MSVRGRVVTVTACALFAAAAVALYSRYIPGSHAAAPKSAPAVPVNVAAVVTRNSSCVLWTH